MSILYRTMQNKIASSKHYLQWYGRSVSLGTITTKQLAEEISHSTTVTRADILAVLDELAVALKNHMLNSQRVVIDGIGSFKAGIQCIPTDKKEDFGANNVKGYRVIYSPETVFVATGVSEKGKQTGFRTKVLLQGATVKELPSNEAKSAGSTAGN